MADKRFFGDALSAYAAGQAALPMYLELIEMHRGALSGKRCILESGCGPGLLAKEFLDAGAEVWAVDVSQEALDMTRANAGRYRHRLHTYCLDAQHLPFKDKYFDGVSSMLVLPFIDNPHQYIAEHIRVLKNDGVLAISGPDERAMDVEWMLGEWKRVLEETGRMEDIRHEWDSIRTYILDARSRVKNWLSGDFLSAILSHDFDMFIEEEKVNPLYFGRGYFIVARRDEVVF
ncbi:MAG: class I SAM-dependent methyltransferase [Candidatus Aenigmarchaeota archaeon]|nr:class I SAM-dependent methyltransferase [Candidatus Aenigmarchaeota archaeon]